MGKQLYNGLLTCYAACPTMAASAASMSAARRLVAKTIGPPDRAWIIITTPVACGLSNLFELIEKHNLEHLHEIKSTYSGKHQDQDIFEKQRSVQVVFPRHALSDFEDWAGSIGRDEYYWFAGSYGFPSFRVGNQRFDILYTFDHNKLSCLERALFPQRLIQIPLPLLRKLPEDVRQKFIRDLLTGDANGVLPSAGFCDIADEAETQGGRAFVSGHSPYPITWSMLVNRAVWRYREKVWNTPRGLYWANLWSVPPGKERLIDDLERDLAILSKEMGPYDTYVVCERLSEDQVYVSVTHDVFKGSPYINELITLNHIDKIIHRMAVFIQDIWGEVPL